MKPAIEDNKEPANAPEKGEGARARNRKVLKSEKFGPTKAATATVTRATVDRKPRRLRRYCASLSGKRRGSIISKIG